MTTPLSLLTRASVTATVLLLCACTPASKDKAEPASQPKPALSVNLVSPTSVQWPVDVEAGGNVAAWQESSVGTEVGGLRIARVFVNVGERVRKGQTLAKLNPATVEADRASGLAAVAEAEANLSQAQLNAERAARLSPTGALSKQEVVQYETQKKTAEAKLRAAQAQLAAQDLRLSFTTLVAPDDGVISARAATEGTVVQAGTELFRLIRQSRLEWRAEVKGEALLQLQPGQAVQLKHPLGGTVTGKVRQVAPTVDVSTRNGIVYVDLPADAKLKAGLYVSGRFTLAQAPALTVPQSSLVSRDGITYALRVDKDNHVQAVKVQTGRLNNDAIEIVQGLQAGDRIVGRGAGFLKSGDTVRVVDETAK